MKTQNPTISVIALTNETYELCRRSINYVTKQTIVDQIEMVIVCQDKNNLNEDADELKVFHSVKIVELETLDSTGTALAEGVRRASAPVVVYVEEHNFFPPDLCETTLSEMARTGVRALGFSMLPANPGLIAWVHLYAQFGWVVAPTKPGFVNKLGGHHAAYDRDLLLEFDDDLNPLMGTENIFHEILFSRGIKMYLTDQIAVPHVQLSNLKNLILHDFVSQRTYASSRMETQNWSLLRRALYAGGSFLIPFLRTARIVRHMARTKRWRMLLPDAMLATFGVTISGSIGEAIGYVFGASDAASAERFEIETHRYDFVTEKDRQRLAKLERAN